jgi:hypothetical protein
MTPRSGLYVSLACLAVAAGPAFAWTILRRSPPPGPAGDPGPGEGDVVVKASLPRPGAERPGIDRLAAAVLVRLDEIEQLREDVSDQKAAVSKAEAAERQARLDLEVATLTAREYEEGLARQDAETADAEIALAELEARSAREALPNPDESAILRTRLALELARTKRDVLTRLTRARRGAELRRDVERARDEAAARRATLSQERNDLSRLERQLAAAAQTSDETRALALLDEASHPSPGRDPSSVARDATEASRIWALAQHHRDQLKTVDALRRVHATVSDAP